MDTRNETKTMTKNNQQFTWGKYSQNALDYITNSTTWINIAVGSVRSGKTITALTRYLEFILTSPHTDFMLVGKTLGAIERNAARPLKAMLRSLNIPVRHDRHNNEIHFKDKTIALYGMGKKDDEEKIQGSTFAGAFIDEGTVITEAAFKMILSRLSEEGAKLFVTCNPSNPNHFLYTEYISNRTLLDKDKLRKWTFILEENKNLSSEYIENLKASYPEDSVFYKRYILGEWVSGHGAIYDKFTDDNIYHEQRPLEEYDVIGVSCDYGTSSTTCYSLIGVQYHDTHNTYEIIHEKGYNAQQEGVTQTDAERVEDILQLQNEYQLGEDNIFYCPHDAESLRAALEKDHRIRMTIRTFTPDTMECISMISSLFYKGFLKVHIDCKETIKQIRSYEWDMKAAQKGIDKPVKKDDHYVDSMRGVIMCNLFDDLDMGDLVHLW